MESEARNHIKKYYNNFFYATVCHVCKRFGDGSVTLKRCNACKMIAYCGEEHQKHHWQQHKPVCNAIRDVLEKYNLSDHFRTEDDWVNHKHAFVWEVLKRLESPEGLKPYENQMLCFPKECLICFRWKTKLEICQKCAGSYCEFHRYGMAHRDICDILEVRFRTELFSIDKENNLPDLQPYLQNFVQEYPHISCKRTFQNMEDFIKAFRNIDVYCVQKLRDPRPAVNSEYLTYPLTLFHAMRLLNHVPKSKDLVVHFVGAREGDEMTLIGWEILPCLIGATAPVVVILIGPELPCKSNPSHDCDNCRSREKKCLTLELHDMSYENYVRSSSFVKPDLVIGFNWGLRTEELPIKFDEQAIKLIAEQNCPFILTSSSLRSFEKETKMINKILYHKVDHLYSGKNPFASLIPYRTFGTEYVSFINQYIIIYKSLFVPDMFKLSDRYKLMTVSADEKKAPEMTHTIYLDLN